MQSLISTLQLWLAPKCTSYQVSCPSLELLSNTFYKCVTCVSFFNFFSIQNICFTILLMYTNLVLSWWHSRCLRLIHLLISGHELADLPSDLLVVNTTQRVTFFSRNFFHLSLYENKIRIVRPRTSSDIGLLAYESILYIKAERNINTRHALVIKLLTVCQAGFVKKIIFFRI